MNATIISHWVLLGYLIDIHVGPILEWFFIKHKIVGVALSLLLSTGWFQEQIRAWFNM